MAVTRAERLLERTSERGQAGDVEFAGNRQRRAVVRPRPAGDR
jgi:hypothetical protein